MALFDSIISETSERFDLTDDQAKALLTALLDFASDRKNGGTSGFQNRFRAAAAANDPAYSSRLASDAGQFSKEQIESTLGAETIAALADRADLDYAATVSALAFMLPPTIERLAPNGKALDENTLRAEIENLSGAAVEPATERTPLKAVLTEAFDRVGDASKTVGVTQSAETSGEALDFAAAGDRFSGAPAAVNADNRAEVLSDELTNDSPLSWIVPLILTALLVALGFWFCGKSAPPHASVETDSAKASTLPSV